ncbi:MAG: NAD(P)H-dependent oxidoreductase [Methanospirillaceae archaeon]|nr:NAD(P)H-dependent oxidoreductase [Methanospirillaceae archaeon]
MSNNLEETGSKKAGEENPSWRCTVCGFVFFGKKPPKGCPRCHSPSREFRTVLTHRSLVYDGKPADVLLINGSTHRAGNTGFLVDCAEELLRETGVLYQRYNLAEYSIDPCWCCYSIRDESCTYPCRNKEDDMPAFHQMIAASKAVIIASPINWNTMAVRLKIFLDRMTCMENLYHLGKPGLTEGKIAGILICGHEDGAIKTALDIFFVLQQMGFILAPFGIGFRTHGSEYNSSTDADFFRTDNLIAQQIQGVVHNVIEMMRLDPESALRGKLIPVGE